MKILKCIRGILLLLLVFCHTSVKSQDMGTIEALINDHKQIRSALITRSALETVNVVLHEGTMEQTELYRALNDTLSVYYKCFNMIDFLYSTGVTAFNAYNSYKDVKQDLQNLWELNNEFVEKCLLKGNIVREDSLIINTYERLAESVLHDAEALYKSYTDIAFYATNTVQCTTARLINILNQINNTLDHIRHAVHRCYYILWKYITIRIHAWKSALYRANMKTKAECVNEAMERWRQSRIEPFQGKVSTLSEKYPK